MQRYEKVLRPGIKKVGAARGREAQSKKDRVENEGFDHYQAFMTHVKCAEEVEACA